jgi:hypothetical protein
MPTPPDPALRALLRRADPASDPAASDVSAAAFAADVHARLRTLDCGTLVPPLTARPGAPRLRFLAPARLPARALARQLLPLAAALAVLASLGTGSAVAYARERDARTDTFATAYARSIDPWQMHAAVPATAPASATTAPTSASDPHAGHNH